MKIACRDSLGFPAMLSKKGTNDKNKRGLLMTYHYTLTRAMN